MATHTYDTLIVGAGFTGVGTAIKLTKAGVDDIVILERADRVGGTWRDNTYPGIACDIPSLLYSFSFAKNPNWSSAYPSGSEICRHIEEMATGFDLNRRIRFGTEVSGLSFDEEAGVWTATTKQRAPYRARTVVLASGPLADSSLPDIRGIDSYEGHKIRSARWDHDYDFTGKRDTDRPGTGKASRVRQGLPAHSRLGAAAAEPGHPDRRAGAVREGTRCSASGP